MLGSWLTGCGGSPSPAGAPAPNWANTLSAAKAAHAIEATFRDGSAEQRATAESDLRAFISKYPSDPQCLSMRLRLAWLLLLRDRLAESSQILQAYGDATTGVDRDWATTLEGALLRRQGKSVLALTRLLTLEGRIVDAPLREIWSEETTLAALAASQIPSALRVLVMWRASGQDDRSHLTQSRIEGLLLRITPSQLAAELEPLTAQAALPVAESSVSQARAWLLEWVRSRLAGDAIERKDADLARRLLRAADARFVHSTLGDALRELSTQGASPVLVMQPAIGLLLEMQNGWLSRRSAELVTGAMRALSRAGDTFPIRLINREVRATDQASIVEGLNALVRDGSAIVIAGLSYESANLAYALSEAQHVVVISLTELKTQAPTAPQWFSVDSAATTLDRMLPSNQLGGPLRINSQSEICQTGELATLAASSNRHNLLDLLLLADEVCSRRVVEALAPEGRLGRVWLGPEAASAMDLGGNVRLMNSPRLGGLTVSQVTTDWQSRFQRMPFWYEALGYDVVTLSSQALSRLAVGSVSGADAIYRERTRIATALLQAKSELLTSTDAGFNAEHRLSPTLMEIPTTPGARVSTPATGAN